MSDQLKRYARRCIYAFGPTRRLSYKLWSPGEKEPALADCRSLIHVGANEGQERYVYESMGLEVLWVEPIPEVFARLERNIRGIRMQRAAKALLSDKPGRTRKLNISNNNGLSSSIFELAEHRTIWPDVHYIDQIECITATLDDLLPLLPSPDALVLDTQGSELMVLAGAEDTLRGVRTLKVEAADFRSYEGGCSDVDLVGFLSARGFELHNRRRFAKHPGGGGYFDLVFRRMDHQPKPAAV
jgi:FkbM family methyltransferase